MEEKISLLCEKYANYPLSSLFIEACFKTLTSVNQKEKQINYFISNHFMQSFKAEDICTYETVRKLAAHWNNVAFEKLNNHDYLNYKYCLNTVANYRIVSKYYELNFN